MSPHTDTRTDLWTLLRTAHSALRSVDASDTTKPPADAVLDRVSGAVEALENAARAAGVDFDRGAAA